MFEILKPKKKSPPLQARCPQCNHPFPVIVDAPSFSFDCEKNVLILLNHYICERGHKAESWMGAYMYKLAPMTRAEMDRAGYNQVTFRKVPQEPIIEEKK